MIGEPRALAQKFVRFAEVECRGASPLYERLAHSIADDDEILELAAHAAPGQPAPNPRVRLDTILNREGWHTRTGSWFGDAIYGANDGLGAVFGIVSGVAGATTNSSPPSSRSIALLTRAIETPPALSVRPRHLTASPFRSESGLSS